MPILLQDTRFKILALALIYYLSGKISFIIFQQDSIVTLSAFAPEGFALAAALIFGRSILPGIFLGQFILAFDQQMPFTASLGIGLINMVEAYLAIWLFDYFHLDRRLKSLRDVFGLLLMILLVLQPFSALLGNTFLLFYSHIGMQSFLQDTFFWWSGNVMGQLLFTPMILVLYYDKESHKPLHYLFIIILFIAMNYLLQVTLEVDSISILLTMTLPVTIYLSTISLAYGSIASVTLASISLVLVHFHLGTFARGVSQVDGLIDLNFFMLSHITLALLVGTLFREKEEAIRTLKAMAHYDYLTGLPNRHLLREEIHHAVYLAHEYGEKSVVCFIDLDGFKKVNDQFGHHIGDDLLKAITKKLKTFTRSEDALLRIGGDEFLLIFNRVKSIDNLKKTLKEILDAIASIENINGHPIKVSLSIGVSCCPQTGTTVEALMGASDDAMYQAKERGKNCFVFAESCQATVS
jgi:diguanylate cyclase (GGDEF)-like protein